MRCSKGVYRVHDIATIRRLRRVIACWPTLQRINETGNVRTYVAKAIPQEDGGQTYERKSHIDHILLRPGMYIGAIQDTTQTMWVPKALTEQKVQFELTPVRYNPGASKSCEIFITWSHLF